MVVLGLVLYPEVEPRHPLPGGGQPKPLGRLPLGQLDKGPGGHLFPERVGLKEKEKSVLMVVFRVFLRLMLACADPAERWNAARWPYPPPWPVSPELTPTIFSGTGLTCYCAPEKIAKKMPIWLPLNGAGKQRLSSSPMWHPRLSSGTMSRTSGWLRLCRGT